MLLQVANATLFASLLFGALFLWLTAPLAPALLDVSLPLPKRAALVIAAAAAAILARLALARARRAGPDAAVPMLAGVGLAQVLAAALGVWLLAVHVPDPTLHAYPALVFAFVAYLVLHAAIGAVLAGFGIWRCRAGFVARDRLGDLAIGTLWHDHTAAATLSAVLFLAALGELIPFGALMVQP